MATSTPVLAPFSTSPDPTTLYLTPALKTTLYKTQYTIETRQGLAAILGDVGLGKSTLMRYLFARLTALPNTIGTFLPTPTYRSSFAMLKKICSDFGIDAARSELAQQEALERWVVEQYEAGQCVLLFVDEAQRLKPDQLELVRTLLNFETAKVKLVQIVLAGQLDLRDKLLTRKYKPLLSRIFSPALLVPLEYTEMVEMLRSRCDLQSVPWPFSGDEPLRLLYEASGGVPRWALQGAQMAYGMAGALGTGAIDADLMREVIESRNLREGEE